MYLKPLYKQKYSAPSLPQLSIVIWVGEVSWPFLRPCQHVHCCHPCSVHLGICIVRLYKGSFLCYKETFSANFPDVLSLTITVFQKPLSLECFENVANGIQITTQVCILIDCDFWKWSLLQREDYLRVEDYTYL